MTPEERAEAIVKGDAACITLTEQNDLAHLIAAAIREAVEADQKQTYDYAKRLCVHMAAHFPANPDWRPLPDLMGVLTQIDNMLTAMVHEDAVEAEREACAKIADEQREMFSSPRYAAGPLGAMNEKFACITIANAIRARGKR